MLKRIGFFILMNVAILIVANIFLYILGLLWVPVWRWTMTWLFVFCLVASFVWTWISLMLSKWMVKSFYGINLVNSENLYNLSRKEKLVYDVVKDLSQRYNIKMPEVGFYADSEPNAFATWPSKNNSLVAVSTGLLDLMDEDAIEWVVGHEMAHILNWDMVTTALLQWVLNTFVLFFAKIIADLVAQFVWEDYAWIARFTVDLVLQMIFGFLASFVAMWFSRHREYKADAGSAKYVWKEKMIAWLQALLKMQDDMHESNKQYATMQISSRKATGLMALLSSHPDLEDRIKALEELKIN